jgi:hypothetical protein
MTERWTITGTTRQQEIAREAFARIKFPFDRLTRLPGRPELGWRDLNSGSYAVAAEEKARHHEGHHDTEDKPDALEGEVDGRRWVMGVIYTQSGRIYLDVRLERSPELAMAVVGAEIAHAVDFFLPMTDAMRGELLRLWGKPGTTWWEVADYGSEYFRLGGEAFMGEFVKAYSDLPFDSTPFLHDAGVEPADVRRILGIERTDYAPPAPPPVPRPVAVTYGKSKVYHKPTHYPRAGKPVNDLTGLKPCKVCKPAPT